MNKDAKIYVAGHRGLVGSALLRSLVAKGYHNLVLRTHAELELRWAATTSLRKGINSAYQSYLEQAQ